MNPYGVHSKIWKAILDGCFHYPQVSSVILYGSRARGDFKQGSDIDIAIDAPAMSSTQFSALWNALDELPIVYSLDIVHLQQLKNPTLLDAIKKDGIVIEKTNCKITSARQD